MNYFALFGLDTDFCIDDAVLNAQYRQLIAQFHPDKTAHLSSFEQKQAMMTTATLNEAYRVLSSPLERAAYLLKQQQIDVDDPTNTHFPADFLMQQMQWREALQENHDLLSLQNEIQQAFDILLQKIKTALTEQNYFQAADFVRQGRFLDKLLSEIQSKIL